MHLFLSPHFDDAVLSCGGTIHQLAQTGEAVCVYTVMAGRWPDPAPDSPIIRELHARWNAGTDPLHTRAGEDQRAVKSLGARIVQQTTLPDCVYRTAGGITLYPSEESLFGDVHHADPALSFLSDITPPDWDTVSHLYVPLGVGHHVDHQIVRDWGLALGKSNPAVALRFYEEYPYTRDHAAINRALDYYVQPVNRLDVYLTAQDISAKIRAIGYYQSQISTFWADADAMARDVQASLVRADDANATPLERYRQLEIIETTSPRG